MNAGYTILTCPHISSKIFFQFSGIQTPSCIAFKEAIKQGELVVCKQLGFVLNIHNRAVKEIKKLDTILYWLFEAPHIEIIF